MKAPIDHATCSELLRDHVAGLLEARQSELVEAHLRDCQDCRAEAGVVAALAGDVDPLTEHERHRLRTSVGSALKSPERQVVTLPAHRSWRTRMLPALGAAAVLLLAGTAVMGGLFSTSDEDPSFDVGAESAEEGERTGGDSGGAEGGADRAAKDEVQADSDLESAAGQSPESASEFSSAPGAGPSFDPSAGDLNANSLKAIGQKGEPFASIGRSVSASDVTALRDEYAAGLSGQAPSDAARTDRGLHPTDPRGPLRCTPRLCRLRHL